MYFRELNGITLAMASATTGAMRLGPVWKSSGSRSAMRYWLKENPPGMASTGVLMR